MMADRYRDDYNDRSRGYGRGNDSDRTVQGSGYGGRNWAERTGDEVASWVGDDDAERRRERDRQTIGRYPGEDRGERNYGASGYSDRSRGQDYGSSSRSGGYGRSDDDRSGYRGIDGRDYSDRTVEGSGYGGRNWAERTGDEVASWVGDSDAERRREKDRQTIGRYPGEGRGERDYGGSSNYGSSSSRGYDNDRTVQGSGYGGRNWAERTGDEVASWVGDSDAERRREKDRQTIGRYPGEDRGERDYGGSSYGSSRYGSSGGDRSYGGRTGSSGSSYSSNDDRGSSSRYGSGRGYDDRPSGSDRSSGDNRDFISRASDEVKSWFGDSEAERRREQDSARDESRGSYADSRSSGSAGSTALGAATGYSASSMGHSPEYAAYRQARVDEYDRDYQAYRDGKKGEFEKEFQAWRSTRTGATGTLREHQKVVGSDGQHVGEIDHVMGADLKLTRKDTTDNKHHLIPTSWVASIEGDTVKLSKTADEAKREWRDAEEKQASNGASTAASGSTATSTTQAASR